MKLDREMILKHKFWILLVVSLPLSLGAVFVLATSVSGDIGRNRDKLDNELGSFLRTKVVRDASAIAALKREADIEKAREMVLWEQAYADQEHLFVWPQAVEAEFNFRSGKFAQEIRKIGEPFPEDQDRLIHGVVKRQAGRYMEIATSDKKAHKIYPSRRVATIPMDGKDVPFERIPVGTTVAVAFHQGKYFNEPLTPAELTTYKGLKVYLSQIDPLLAQVKPMNEKGEGVMQFKPLNGQWFYKEGEWPPKKEEQTFLNYLDQEWANSSGDFSEEAWLAQEDIWVQHELYRLVGLANDHVGKFVGTGGSEKNKRYTFQNPFWELGVTWDGDRKLTLSMKNLQSRRQKVDVRFRVWFTQNTAPETIQVGGRDALGPRGTQEAETTFNITLPAGAQARTGIFGIGQVLTWETAAIKRIDQVSVGSMALHEISHSHRTYPEGMRALNPDARRKIKKPFGTNDLTSSHKLIRNRYVEVTPQTRRIPVSMSLIVDQDRLDRVQTVFNNSRLRFLTTQILLNRYPQSVRPQLPKEVSGAGGQQAVRSVPTALPPVTPFGASNPDNMETNIEMEIYGIVTLYERYPPPLKVEP